MAERNAKIVTEQLGCLDTMDGNFNQIGIWKVKKKNEFGNLVTAPTALKKAVPSNIQNQVGT